MSHHVYAMHHRRGRPWSARLFRFDSPILRGLRAHRDPRRWTFVPPQRVAGLAARTDARRAWRYEGPGVWSAPLGAWRSLRWRVLGTRG